MKNLIKRILREEEDLQWAQDAVSGEIRPTRSLIIKQQTDNPKDAIEVHFEVMFGDADGYSNNKHIFYRKPKNEYESNFQDFEDMITFLKSDTSFHELDEEYQDKLRDYGLVDYNEHFGDDWEVGTITSVYYYDENGNKYNAKIDGYEDTFHVNDEDEDWGEEEDWDDDGGWGDDEDDQDNEDEDENDDNDGPRVVRWNIPD